MTRSARFKKQYKAIAFGEPYDPQSAEGHRNAVNEAIETRRYNRLVKEREAEKARSSARSWIAKLWERLF